MITPSEKASIFLAHLSMHNTHNGLVILSVLVDETQTTKTQRLLEYIDALVLEFSDANMKPQHKAFLLFAADVGVEALLDYDSCVGGFAPNPAIIDAIPDTYLSFEVAQGMRNLFLATEKNQKLQIARRITDASTRILQNPDRNPCDLICVAAIMDYMLGFLSTQGSDRPWLLTKYPASQEYAAYAQAHHDAIDHVRMPAVA